MIRMILSTLLALILALTSQSMAIAKGGSAASGQMVLCTGSGPVVVYVDAEGQPTSAPHICPDAALNILIEGATPIPVAVTRVLACAPETTLAPLSVPARPGIRPPSRAPPVLI